MYTKNQIKKAGKTFKYIGDLKNKNVIKFSAKKHLNFDINEENAAHLLDKIKSERKGIGFPDSIDLVKFIRTSKVLFFVSKTSKEKSLIILRLLKFSIYLKRLNLQILQEI